MKKVVFMLLMLLHLIPQVTAQSISLVLKDIQNTLDEFCTELNSLKDNHDSINIQAIAANFSSSKFYRNETEMNMADWIETYFHTNLSSTDLVEHTIDIKEQTFKKVKVNVNDDKRYRFKAELKRKRMVLGHEQPLPNETLTFIVVWKGGGNFGTISMLNGDIRPVPRNYELHNQIIEKALGYIDSATPEMALDLLTALAEEGHAGAYNELTKIYDHGPVQLKNERKALDAIKKSAELNDAEGLNNLGIYYYHGKVESKDYEKAFQYFTRSAELGNINAEYNLGVCYERGDGVPQDFQEAKLLFERAAKKGHSSTWATLDRMYIKDKDNSNNSLSQTGNSDILSGTYRRSRIDRAKARSLARNRINGHEYVDLGLSVKWATCNIGASEASERGHKYGWGEIESHFVCKDNSKTYKVKEITEITGNPNYDVATALWGDGWRVPTANEMNELIVRCNWEWSSKDGNPGFLVTGPNGNSIFLPGENISNNWYEGTYWTATSLTNKKEAACIYFLGEYKLYNPSSFDLATPTIINPSLTDRLRYIGLFIHPVAD